MIWLEYILVFLIVGCAVWYVFSVFKKMFSKPKGTAQAKETKASLTINNKPLK